MVRSGRQRVVREGWRGRRSRHGRVGSRPLGLAGVPVVAIKRIVVAKSPRVTAGVGGEATAGRVVLGSVHVRSERVPRKHGDIARVGVGSRYGVRRVRLRRRDVGRTQRRGRRGADSPGSWGRRREHAVGLELLVGPVSSLGVGVVVYPRMTSQLVGAGELLATSGELASMGLLAGVSSNVPRLMLETVEGLVAHGTLVRSRELSRSVGGLTAIRDGPVRLEIRRAGHCGCCCYCLNVSKVDQKVV